MSTLSIETTSKPVFVPLQNDLLERLSDTAEKLAEPKTPAPITPRSARKRPY